MASHRVLVVDDSATIRRIVDKTLTRAGYEVLLASDGQQALELAMGKGPDLVLVDFVMPKMNGYQLCQALHAVDNLRRVPVVLMSARAERIADQFIAQTGAVDALAKPFSPEALLAVTAHAIERGMRESAPPAPPVSELAGATPSKLPPRPPQLTPSGGMPRPTDPDVAAKALAEAHLAASIRLADTLAPALAEHVPAVALQEAIARLSPDVLALALREASLLAPATGGVIALAGRIDHAALGDVLQMLQMQTQTGVLEVEHQKRVVAVQFRAGLVDLAVARGVDAEFLLGRYLLEDEVIEREDLDVLLRNHKQEGGPRRLLGDQLVKLGYITEEDLRRALVRQSSELVYEALRWRDGAYRFVKWAQRPEAETAQLALPVASILMEGLRRVDEWRLIEEQIHDFDQVFERDPHALAAVDETTLTREERLVLNAVDAKRTVRQVVVHTHLGSFDACKALFQFATSRLVRPAR